MFVLSMVGITCPRGAGGRGGGGHCVCIHCGLSAS